MAQHTGQDRSNVHRRRQRLPSYLQAAQDEAFAEYLAYEAQLVETQFQYLPNVKK